MKLANKTLRPKANGPADFGRYVTKIVNYAKILKGIL